MLSQRQHQDIKNDLPGEPPARLWFCIWANFFLLHFTKYLRLRAEVATRATHIQYGMCFIFVLKSTISGAETQNFLRPRRDVHIQK